MKRLNLLLICLCFPIFLYAQNFWESTKGPLAGSVRSLAINDSGHIFAGTYGSGVFCSTDNGNNWTQINNTFKYSYVYSLAINDSGHVFAGTYGSGIFRSTDNGSNWTQINSGLTNISINSLAINSSGYIFAGTDNNVYRSTNNGNNWTKIGTLLGLESVIYSIAINNGAIFAGAADNIFRSTDNGNNWTSMVKIGGGTIRNTYVTSLAINSSGNIFAGIIIIGEYFVQRIMVVTGLKYILAVWILVTFMH